MKTTLIIDDQVMTRIEAEAARRGATISALVESAMRLLLHECETPAELPELPSFDGGGALVDVTDRDELHAAVDDEPWDWRALINRDLNDIDRKSTGKSFEEVAVAYQAVHDRHLAENATAVADATLRRHILKRLYMWAYHCKRPLEELEQYFKEHESLGSSLLDHVTLHLVRTRFLERRGRDQDAERALDSIRRLLNDLLDATDRALKRIRDKG